MVPESRLARVETVTIGTVEVRPGDTLWFQVVPGVEHWIRVSVISINRGRIVVRPLRRTDVPWAEAEIPDFTRFRTRRPDPRDALRARLNGEHATRAAFPDRSDDMLPIDGGGAVVWPLVIAVVLGIVAGLCGLIGFGAASTVLALVGIAAVGVFVGRKGPSA